ncbi:MULTISPECIES: hypothetical protein [Nocardiaceae]|uniref:hypothetical protein n=1 Tax=Nocardiaceae TaxID=85025 RepID=UPI0012D2B98F|nr:MULTISPECIES: hypothetical protein [Rhodococcus]
MRVVEVIARSQRLVLVRNSQRHHPKLFDGHQNSTAVLEYFHESEVFLEQRLGL